MKKDKSKKRQEKETLDLFAKTIQMKKIETLTRMKSNDINQVLLFTMTKFNTLFNYLLLLVLKVFVCCFYCVIFQSHP